MPAYVVSAFRRTLMIAAFVVAVCALGPPEGGHYVAAAQDKPAPTFRGGTSLPTLR